MKKTLILILFISLLLGGCSSESKEEEPQKENEVQITAETPQETVEQIEENSKPVDSQNGNVADNTDMGQEPKIIDLDYDAMAAGDYSLLVGYIDLAIDDVIHDLGEPNDLDESNAFYDDFNFNYDGGTELVSSVTVTNGELIMMKTGMTKDELVGVMGEPLYKSDFLWEYYDTDRMFSIWFMGEEISSITYAVNSDYVSDDYEYESVEEPEYIGISEDGLIIWSADFINDNDFYYIVGQIENPNAYDIKNVTIEFGIYDQAGNLIETSEDFIRTFVGGSTWKYKVMVLNEQAYSYKILSVESW